MSDIKRMWINQPSSLQPLHKLHGVNVLAEHEYDDTFRVYFLAGETISCQVDRLALSEGWNSNSRPVEKLAEFARRQNESAAISADEEQTPGGMGPSL